MGWTTMSVKADGFAVTTDDIGKVLCTDGSLYTTITDANNAGKTPAAMIAYVNVDDGYGLGIAFEDEPEGYTWFTAKGAAEAHEPVTAGAIWKVPSVVEYKLMMGGCAGHNLIPTNLAYPGGTQSASFYSNLKAAMIAARITPMQNDFYWTDDEYIGNNQDWGVHIYFFEDNNTPLAQLSHESKETSARRLVRACLRFNVVQATPTYSELVYEYNTTKMTATVIESPDKYSGDIVIPPTTVKDNVTYDVTQIAVNAFANCTALTSVTIPASVTKIDYPLFTGSENLTSIVVEEGNQVFDSHDNCNAIIKKGDKALVAGCKTTVIPNDVRELYNKSLAFKSLTSITIPNSVKIMQPGVFKGSSLISINIPASVEHMFDNPLQGCDKLTTITVDAGNNYFEDRGSNAVIEKGSNKLVASCKTTVIPESVTAIGEYAFARRSDLTTMDIPGSVEELYEDAFDECSNLQSVTASDNLAKIGDYAFRACGNLKTAHFGTGLQYVGGYVFTYCNNLTDVYINAPQVPQTGDNPFEYLPASLKIHVPNSLVTKYQSTWPWSQYTIVGEGSGGEGGGESGEQTDVTRFTFNNASAPNTQNESLLYTKEGKTWTGESFVSSGTLPFTNAKVEDEDCIAMNPNTNGVFDGMIQNKSFQINTTIKTVTIRIAGQVEFVKCEIFGNGGSVTNEQPEIFEQDFFNEYIFTFAGNEYADAKLAFSVHGQGTLHLKSITISDEDGGSGGEGGGGTEPKLTGKTGDLIWMAEKIGKIWIESGSRKRVPVETDTYRITLTGNGASADYESTQNEAGEQMNTTPWNDLGVITEVVVGEGVTRIGSYAFNWCQFLESISLPSTLQEIGEHAFHNCAGLTTLTLPESLQKIESGAFAFLTQIKTLTIPAALVDIEPTAFQGTRIESFVIARNNPKFCSPEGSACIILKENNQLLFGSPLTVIPETVTSIGKFAFFNGYNLKTMTIPSSVTSIGMWAFAANYQLTQIELPASITNIGSYVFYNCRSLADITCYPDPETLTWDGFDNAQMFMPNKATKCHVPANLYEKWISKFGNMNVTFVGDLESTEPEPEQPTEKADPELAFDMQGVETTYGQQPAWPTLTNKYQLEIQWKAADEKVATVDRSGNVTIVGTGTTTIAAQFMGNDNYEAGTATYTLTVAKADATLSFRVETVTQELGTTVTEWPVATINPAGLAFEYSVEKPEVATVDETTGVVTMLSAGTTEVKAFFPGNDLYNPADTHYTLTITKAEPDPEPQPQLVSPELGFTKGEITTTYGKLPITPTLKNKWQVETLWKSENTNVATVDSEGNLTVTGIGTTTISAYYEGDDTFEGDTVTYTLTVEKGNPEINFATSLYTCVMGATAEEWPVVTTTPEGLDVSYSSKNTDVATVDSQTGAVTLKGTGNAVIQATFKGNDLYNGAEAIYTLSVAKPDAKEPQLDFNGISALSVTKGEEFTAPVINNPEALALTWSTDNADVATVDADGNLTINNLGSTTVTATWAGNDEWKAASASYLLEVRIVETIVEETTVSFGGDDSGITETTNLENTTIGGVLFTMDSNQGDGYDKEDASISLQSTLTGAQIDAIISTTEPGSAEFAEAFTGISFLLNAGKGSVDVDFFTMGEHQLSVKLGDKAAATFTKNERGSITIDYDVTEDTWVYIYASVKATSAIRRQHRAPVTEPEVGKLKIYGFNIKPVEVIVTGISEVQSQAAQVSRINGKAYNLQGQRIATPTQKGLYIVNGRKVIVK